MIVESHQVTSGRLRVAFGTPPGVMRAHVQNFVWTKSVAVLRMLITALLSFDLVIIADPMTSRQGNKTEILNMSGFDPDLA